MALTNRSQGAITWIWLVDGVHLSSSADTTYTFSVPGEYPLGLIVSSQEGCIDSAFQILNVVEVTGIGEGVYHQVRLYPNPTPGILTLELGLIWENQISISVSDISGKVVWRKLLQSPQTVKIDLSDKENGLYLIYAYDSKREFHSRILIQH